MLARLTGLETEYALRFAPREPGGRRVPNRELFEKLRQYVERSMPLAPAIVPLPRCWFLANGGNLKFEVVPFFTFFARAGVVEGATPECRGPRQLLLHQRAQDALLSRAAISSGGSTGDCALLKSNHDSHGNYFGSHENYEAAVATGLRLLLWQILSIPTLILILCLTVVALGVVLALTAPILFVSSPMLLGQRTSRLWVTSFSWFLCLACIPAQIIGQAVFGALAFVDTRRKLLPFLVARTVIAGSGAVRSNGRFALSARVWALRSVCGVGAEAWRSIFYFANFVKAIAGPGGGNPLGRRQRLQITVGDCNMTQYAEYLKVGTTLLVLDAIEAGEFTDAPKLRRPIQALRTIAADPNLSATVTSSDGRRWTALQIQRYYLEGCRRYVARADADQRQQRSAEARHVLQLWEETLDALETDPSLLVGKLDWVTKRHLLEQAGPDAPLEVRKKIDLRYHELSRAGYYLQLEAAGLAPTLVEPEEVIAAINTPPNGTPAEARGRTIRTLGRSGKLRVGWTATEGVPKSEPKPRRTNVVEIIIGFAIIGALTLALIRVVNDVWVALGY